MNRRVFYVKIVEMACECNVLLDQYGVVAYKSLLEKYRTQMSSGDYGRLLDVIIVMNDHYRMQLPGLRYERSQRDRQV